MLVQANGIRFGPADKVNRPGETCQVWEHLTGLPGKAIALYCPIAPNHVWRAALSASSLAGK